MNHPPTRRLPRRDVLAWPGLCALLALASVAAWFYDDSTDLIWTAAYWTHEPWVLWTASVIHLSLSHLLANMAALLVLAVLGSYLQAGPTSAVALLLAWPLGTLALLWWPQVTWYSGMSGLLNAMAAVLWAHAALHAARPLSFVIFASMGLKLLSEHAWSQPIAFDPNWGFNVVYAAHLAGAAAGAVCGIALEGIAEIAKRVRA